MAVRAIKNLTELQQLIVSPKLTVVDFFATWCGPCKVIAPRIHDLAMATPQVQFCKVDVDEARDVAQQYGIRAMPTFIFFKANTKVDMFEGADYNQLAAMIQRHGTPAAPPPPSKPPVIPGDAELRAMSGKQLLTMMAAHSISSQGLPEKGDLVAELIKHRK